MTFEQRQKVIITATACTERNNMKTVKRRNAREVIEQCACLSFRSRHLSLLYLSLSVYASVCFNLHLFVIRFLSLSLYVYISLFQSSSLFFLPYFLLYSSLSLPLSYNLSLSIHLSTSLTTNLSPLHTLRLFQSIFFPLSI